MLPMLVYLRVLKTLSIGNYQLYFIDFRNLLELTIFVNVYQV